MSVHISEKEFREEIFSLTAVFQNVEEFQKVEKYIKQLLIEIMKNVVVNQEKKNSNIHTAQDSCDTCILDQTL